MPKRVKNPQQGRNVSETNMVNDLFGSIPTPDIYILAIHSLTFSDS